MKPLFLFCSLAILSLFTACSNQHSAILHEGEILNYKGNYGNFDFTTRVKTSPEAQAAVIFHYDGLGQGYEVLIGNGPVDGSRKTGSLAGIRNLYRSMARDDEWFELGISVKGKNISVTVDGAPVVCYSEPEITFRKSQHTGKLLDRGEFVFAARKGTVEFENIEVVELPDNTPAPQGLPAAVDEHLDPIIRLQQSNFPVIDYHVHLKGWGKEEAQLKSMNYGINYGIAPNCGIGFPITDDKGVSEYFDANKNMPFVFGMQGEGREWPQTFSKESRELFDYVFTDALTFTDHKGRRVRLWIDEEVIIDMPRQQYMDQIVDKIVEVVSSEPIDIYVNPFFLPTEMEKEYDNLWTPERINRVVVALKERGIALEINARYRIPNFEIIRAAKDAGIKFAFGTNNGDPEIGKLEYCIEAIEACGLTAEDMWFPSMKNKGDTIFKDDRISLSNNS